MLCAYTFNRLVAELEQRGTSSRGELRRQGQVGEEGEGEGQSCPGGLPTYVLSDGQARVSGEVWGEQIWPDKTLQERVGGSSRGIYKRRGTRCDGGGNIFSTALAEPGARDNPSSVGSIRASSRL